MERADHLRCLLRKRVERAAAHLDPVVVARGREALAVEKLDDRRVRLGLLQMPAPAQPRLVGSRLAVPVAGDDLREHRREQLVLVAAASHPVSGGPVDDARPAATPPSLGHLLDESLAGENTQMPADGVRMKPNGAGEIVRAQTIARGAERVENGLPLGFAVHAAKVITTTLVEITDSSALPLS